MKHLFNILKYSLLLSLVVTMVSCGGSDDPDPTPDPDETLANAVALLTAGEASFSSVTKPTDATELDWKDLKVTFTGTVDGGKYTTTGSADPTVWPAAGTWTFDGTTGTSLIRDADTKTTIAISATTLETTFTIPDPDARTMVVDGEWKFSLAY